MRTVITVFLLTLFFVGCEGNVEKSSYQQTATNNKEPTSVETISTPPQVPTL